MKAFHLPGLALAVVKEGTVVKAQGYGLGCCAQDTSHPDTVLKIGSVSKQFIATGIMLLARDRRLARDDPISKYLQDSRRTICPVLMRGSSSLFRLKAEATSVKRVAERLRV